MKDQPHVIQWYLLLQLYNFYVSRHTGTENKNAEFFSQEEGDLDQPPDTTTQELKGQGVWKWWRIEILKWAVIPYKNDELH